jgi:hypothetical protein
MTTKTAKATALGMTVSVLGMTVPVPVLASSES